MENSYNSVEVIQLSASPSNDFEAEKNNSKFSSKDFKDESRNEDKSNGQECPICLETCTASGDHRVVVTKCGHIFGRNCIVLALKSKLECPTCRKPSKKKELVNIYDCKVIAIDSSKVDILTEQLREQKEISQRVYNIFVDVFFKINLP